jgi:hypothetical protein
VAARKYTRDLLAPLVRDSQTIADVLRKLGLKLTGGSHAYLKRLIREYDLDTTHFVGSRANRGAAHRGGPDRRTPADILVPRDRLAQHVKGQLLRRALIEIGRPYCCAVCGLQPEWNGQALELQIDHLNGERWDNRAENLRFICPNCHSQTANFGAKNKPGRGKNAPENA